MELQSDMKRDSAAVKDDPREPVALLSRGSAGGAKSPVASAHNQLAVANNYSSHFIDLLSLNLDRSKTWVEMTEAKLNYMIGETDAVLRSMCMDSSEDEEQGGQGSGAKKARRAVLAASSRDG